MRLLRALPALLIPLVVASRPAHAQAAECSVDTYQPAQLAQAGLTIQRAAAASTPADASKALRDAMKFLQDEKKLAANPLGTGFLRAQIYILWLHQEGGSEVMTNEALNAPGVKTASVDLIVAADSLFKLVEAQGPGCVEQTQQWRQSKPWTDRLNKAYQFLGADAVDSAEYYLKRSAMLNAKSAFTHNAYAQIADKRGDKDGLLSHLKMAIEMAAADTSLADTRRQMMFQYAANAQQHALAGGAARKNELLKEAVDTFLELLKQQPEGKEAAYSFSAVAEIVGLTQDTARGRAILAPMVADATPYNDLTLLLAADMARMLSRNDDAMAMYAGALKKNPNVRDASYFLAFMYYEKKDFAKMLPLTQKLIEIDPSNPDNYLLHAEALKLAALAEKDAPKKAQLIKDAEAAAKLEAAMLHKLLVTQFERREAGALLAGNIENRGKAAKSYSLTMDFVDASGAVIESVTAEVAAVAPGKTGDFKLEPTKAGIVAYKYRALP